MARNADQGNQRAELRQMMPQVVLKSAMTIHSETVNG
jgi:hypothetical protein